MEAICGMLAFVGLTFVAGAIVVAMDEFQKFMERR